MKDMQMDKTELGCLRAIVLFNPGLWTLIQNEDSFIHSYVYAVVSGHFTSVTKTFILTDAKGLSNPCEVEALREKVYASLESYTKQKYPDQPGR